MFKYLYTLIRSIRPRQWIKNLSVFAAILFSGDLFIPEKFNVVALTFIIFCLLSSGVYLINDIIDKEKDLLHFSKKFRPVASGELSVPVASVLALILVGSGLYLTFVYIGNYYLNVLVLVFISLQLLYSLLLKKLILLDVITIATTFMIRVFAGSFVVGVSLSSWLILTAAMVALFLAIGKRRLELTLMSHPTAIRHRDILSHYPSILLDGLTFMMANSTLLTYSLFTFNQPQNYRQLSLDFLPDTLAYPKLLMVTIPIVIYGIFRYLYIIYEKKQGDSPERVLFNDLPLLSAVLIWFGIIIWAVYFAGK